MWLPRALAKGVLEVLVGGVRDMTGGGMSDLLADGVVLGLEMCSEAGLMVLGSGSCLVPAWGEHDMVLGLLNMSWTAGDDVVGDRVMISMVTG